MELCIQDPNYSKSYLLHEALLDSCYNSIYGAGVYAFVTVDGVNLLLNDSAFAEFMKKGKYTLIVGMDAITTCRALKRLSELKSVYGENIEILAFLHDTKNSTFHPKLSWFKTETGGRVILGSGNLTQKGLRRNREIFNIIDLDDNEFISIQQQWQEWLEVNAKNIREIDDALVVKKAKENQKQSNYIKSTIIKEKTESEKIDLNSVDAISSHIAEDIEEYDAWEFDLNCDVLITEFPKNGDRIKQVNFSKSNFESYFGAIAGQNRVYKIILRYIDSSGNIGEAETRGSVSVASRNYRFELKGVEGIEYSMTNRPILVFVKVSERTFIYELILNKNEIYQKVSNYLNSRIEGRPVIRRLTTTVKDLYDECDKLNIFKYKKGDNEI